MKPMNNRRNTNKQNGYKKRELYICIQSAAEREREFVCEREPKIETRWKRALMKGKL